MDLLEISHPQGPQACRDLMDGVLLTAAMKQLAPSVVLSANISMLTAFSREMPHARAIIAHSLRSILTSIETGDFATKDRVLAQDHSAASGSHLH